MFDSFCCYYQIQISVKRKELAINKVAFLTLGISNNFGYAMMLSAANDLLNGKAPAAVILLCDILPSFIIVLVYPLFQHLLPIKYSTILAVIFGFLGFVCSFFSNTSVSSGILATILISF